MFTQGVHAESSSAQSFHPEFGYLCPTPRMRRRFRSAVITTVAGMAIAAGAALALSPQLAPQSEAGRVVTNPQIEPQSATLLAAAPPAIALPGATLMPPAAGPIVIAQETVPARLVPMAAPTRELAAGSARVSCDDLSDSFLAPRCQQGKAGKSRMAHLARTERARAAAVSIGGADAGPPPTAASAGPAVAANDATAAQPAERPVLAKKPLKTVHKQMPGREVAAAEAAPPAPAPGFGLFSFLRAPTRTGAGAWAMSR
jgi:hypothetical protein